MKELRHEFLKKALETGEDGLNYIETHFEEMRVQYMHRMELLDPNYDATIDEEKLRVLLYLGDDRGFIKLWDFSYLLERSGLTPS